LVVIKLELDPQIESRVDIPGHPVSGHRRQPRGRMKEDVIAKVFGDDETVVTVLGKKFDLSQPPFLDAETLLDARFFVVRFHELTRPLGRLLEFNVASEKGSGIQRHFHDAWLIRH
jgi:hypothetical protein